MKIEYSDLVPFSWAEDTDLESAKGVFGPLGSSVVVLVHCGKDL